MRIKILVIVLLACTVGFKAHGTIGAAKAAKAAHIAALACAMEEGTTCQK